ACRGEWGTRAAYPARATAACNRSNGNGEGACTVARSVARFTLASPTPGTERSARSTRPAQAAQLIPSIANDQSVRGPAGADTVDEDSETPSATDIGRTGRERIVPPRIARAASPCRPRGSATATVRFPAAGGGSPGVPVAHP